MRHGTLEDLRARRAMAEAATGRRSRRRRKPPRQAFPRGSEVRYRRLLRGILDRVEAELLTIRPIVERAASATRQERPDGAAVRVDAPGDDIRRAIAAIRARLGSSILLDATLTAGAAEIAADVGRFNRAAVSRVFESTIGVGLPITEPGVASIMAAFVADNARLITSLAASSVDRVEGTVLRGLRRGLSNREISRSISSDVGVSRRRANLIARDQVASLNGELTQVRQVRMGVTEYVWRSSRDERVRPEHEDLDGTRWSWDSPPPDGHPGEPINCRCQAEPVLDDLFAGL